MIKAREGLNESGFAWKSQLVMGRLMLLKQVGFNTIFRPIESPLWKFSSLVRGSRSAIDATQKMISLRIQFKPRDTAS